MDKMLHSDLFGQYQLLDKLIFMTIQTIYITTENDSS
jgi:hypothetical protein